jgi:DNA-binding MarR family transcriptional regulator
MKDVSTPPADAPILDLGPTLGFMSAVWRLNHALERTSKHMEAALGVTGQQRMIIRIVGRYPAITAGELARALWIDAGTLSAALKRLEARKLVERRRSADDRRKVMLYLTPEGKTFDVPAAATVESAVATTLAGIPEDVATSARQVLEALETELNRNAPSRTPPKRRIG